MKGTKGAEVIRRFLAVAAVVVCGSGLSAMAGEGYIGASYMSTSLESQASGESFNADSDGWKIFGGYNVNKYFGIEVTYYDLGDFSDTVNNTDFDADISVFDTSLRGILPLGEKFDIFGKLGYSYVSIDSSSSNALITASTEAKDWELFWAVGADLKIGKKFAIRADWENWDVEGTLDGWSLGGYFLIGGK